MATICITGGTGMVGTALQHYLVEKGHKLIILTRTPERYSSTNSISYAKWNVDTQEYDAAAFTSSDSIIHLAGAGVAEKRWTNSRKKEIVESRTQSSALLVKALSEQPHHIKTVISASAIGWYGPDKGTVFTEDAPADATFLGETCRLWEESIKPVTQLNIRLVTLRIGIVLSNQGGACVEFKKPLRFGLATILGSGHQIISWVHITDLCRMFEHALQNEGISGPYNATAPKPVSNKELILKLAKQLKGQFYIPVPVPSFALRLAMGEMSIEVLKSCTTSSKKISDTGFQFSFPSIDAALNELTKH